MAFQQRPHGNVSQPSTELGNLTSNTSTASIIFGSNNNYPIMGSTTLPIVAHKPIVQETSQSVINHKPSRPLWSSDKRPTIKTTTIATNQITTTTITETPSTMSTWLRPMPLTSTVPTTVPIISFSRGMSKTYKCIYIFIIIHNYLKNVEFRVVMQELLEEKMPYQANGHGW